MQHLNPNLAASATRLSAIETALISPVRPISPNTTVSALTATFFVA